MPSGALGRPGEPDHSDHSDHALWGPWVIPGNLIILLILIMPSGALGVIPGNLIILIILIMPSGGWRKSPPEGALIKRSKMSKMSKFAGMTGRRTTGEADDGMQSGRSSERP